MKKHDIRKIPFIATSLLLVLGQLLTGCSSTADTTDGTTAAVTSGAAISDSNIVASESTPTVSETYPELYSVDDSKVTQSGTITIAVMHSWAKLNVWDTADDLVANMVNDKIWDKLVYANNEDSIIEPRAAKSWEISDDKLTWTFYLDESCTFSDGTPVTSADWVWTFQAMSDPEVVCVMKSYLSVVEGTDSSGNSTSADSIEVSAPDDYTFVIKFKEPMDEDIFAYQYNAKFAVLPKHLLSDIPRSELLADNFWNKPIGSGPLVVDSEIAGSQIVFKVRDEYQLGNTNVDKVVYKVIEYTNFVPSLISGDVDLHQAYIEYDDAMAALSDGSFAVYKTRFPDVSNIMFLNNSTISDVRVRQAINLAIDKEAYVQISEKGQAVVAETYTIPGSKYYDSSLTYSRNIDEAKDLLAEAGWNSGTVLKWATYGESDGLLLIQQNLAEVGITVEFQIMDIPSIFAGIMDGSYDISSLPFQAYMDPFWTDTIIDSYSSISDETKAALNELKEKIKSEIDDDTKLQLIYEYQEYLHEQMIFIPVCNSYVCKGMSASMKNVDYNSDLTAVWKWVKESK